MTVHLFRKLVIYLWFGFVYKVSPLAQSYKSEADAKCFFEYCTPPNQMKSSPNLSKLKVRKRCV